MSTNSCGTIVRREAASTSGLMWTSCAPRRSASASAGEHPRRVRGGVVADQPDRVGLLPVVQVDGALAGAERRRQRAAARLVAHVRAVGQVVRAELAHPELVEERRLVARAARRCRTTPGPGSSSPRSVSPTSANASSHEIGSYVSRRRVVAHRLGRAGPRPRGRSRSSRASSLTVCAAKKSRVARFGGVSSQVTCLMPFSQMSRCRPVRVVRPRAARAVEAPVLVVHHEERARALDRLARALRARLRDAARGAPAGGGMVVLVPARLPVVGRPAARAPRHARRRAEHALRRNDRLVRSVPDIAAPVAYAPCVHEWLEQAVARLAAAAGDDAGGYVPSEEERARSARGFTRVAAHESGDRTNAPLALLPRRPRRAAGIPELSVAALVDAAADER